MRYRLYVKELLNRKRSSKLPRAPELGSERGGRGVDRTGRSGVNNTQYGKRKATGAYYDVRLDTMEMAGYVGASGQGHRKATERVYAGGKDTDAVEDGPDRADMEEQRGCA